MMVRIEGLIIFYSVTKGFYSSSNPALFLIRVRRNGANYGCNYHSASGNACTSLNFGRNRHSASSDTCTSLFFANDTALRNTDKKTSQNLYINNSSLLHDRRRIRIKLFFIAYKQLFLRLYKRLLIIKFSLIPPVLFIVIFIASNIMGCSSTSNYAPVRPYQRDLINNHQYYVVKRGDTLYSIGFRSGHGYQRLAKWNKISSPYKLQIGQKLNLFELKQYVKNPVTKVEKNNIAVRKKIITQKTLTISNNNKKVLKLTWQWPIEGKILKNFTKSGNKGIDIDGKIGQEVKSAAAGKVVYTGSGLTGYGNLLIVKHNYLYLSAYANNSRLYVKEGQTVKQGQIIAEVGRVGGRQTSLHFEIRKNGKPVNPLQYLPKK